MDTNPEIRERILAAAAQLFEQSGRKELPTVDAVRKLSRTSMNDASAVMREWRRLQIVSATAAVVSVPERVSQASAAALSTLWGEAQELANESLNVAQAAWDAERAEAEKLRVELSSAFELQGAELEAVKIKLAEVEGRASAAAAEAEIEKGAFRQQVNVLTDQAHTAMARVQEIEKRAEDLSRALDLAHGTEKRLTLELEAERKTLGVLRETLNALHLESATVKARLEAQASVQADQTERLKRLEGALVAERSTAAAAREEAAKLTGQAEALRSQQAELMRVIEAREGERSAPRGGKK
jgi:chromosome segregation ATPase